MEVIIEKSVRDKEIMAMGKVLYDIPMIDSYVLQIDEKNLSKFKSLKKVTYYQIARIAAQLDNNGTCL